MQTNNRITARQVNDAIAPYLKKKTLTPFLILLIDLIAFVGLFFALIMVDNVLLKIVLAILEGNLIGYLFIVGHDACHNSFTANKKLNKILAIITFLPSLHNYSLWRVLHNDVHHGYTNLKQKDHVYTPLSPEEYLDLSWMEKMKYKLDRSILGHCVYYGYDIWFKKTIIPDSSLYKVENTREHWLNVIPLVLYTVVLFGATIYLSSFFGKDILTNIFYVIVLPFLIWNWMMGFVIYQHHTNLDTRWFDNKKEWYYWEAQIENTVHIQFPQPLNFIFHNIMEHTAHHSNMNIPMYNLVKAQKSLEDVFSGRVKIINWTFGYYFTSIQKCKLYDYKTHQWLSFKDVKAYSTDLKLQRG